MTQETTDVIQKVEDSFYRTTYAIKKDQKPKLDALVEASGARSFAEFLVSIINSPDAVETTQRMVREYKIANNLNVSPQKEVLRAVKSATPEQLAAIQAILAGNTETQGE